MESSPTNTMVHCVMIVFEHEEDKNKFLKCCKKNANPVDNNDYFAKNATGKVSNHFTFDQDEVTKISRVEISFLANNKELLLTF